MGEERECNSKTAKMRDERNIPGKWKNQIWGYILLAITELVTASQETQLRVWSFGPCGPVVFWCHLSGEREVSNESTGLLPISCLLLVQVHPSGVKFSTIPPENP